MKVRRDISSIPLRSAASTWESIIELATDGDTLDRDQLVAAGPVIASLITDELMRDEPFVFSGVGARLVIYLRYGANAVQEDSTVDGLTWNPTAGDWKLAVPCAPEDLGWARDALSEKSPRITLHDVNGDARERDNNSASAPAPLVVDWSGGAE